MLLYLEFNSSYYVFEIVGAGVELFELDVLEGKYDLTVRALLSYHVEKAEADVAYAVFAVKHG